MHLEDELSETVRVFVVEQQCIAGVSCSRFEQQQEELVPRRAGLQQSQQQLQDPTQLQHSTVAETQHSALH